MAERRPIKRTLIVAMGDALEGHDGLFDSGDGLVEMIVGTPPRYNSPAVSAEYFHDRTVELLDRVQLGLMLANADAVEQLAPAQRDELDRSRADPPDVSVWNAEPRLVMMSHRRSGKFLRVEGNVGVVPIHFGPVRWLLALRSVGALDWAVLPTLVERAEGREAP